MKISNRKTNIERELPFILSELSILASTGLSPIGILRKMAKRNENDIISAEFRRIIYKIDVEGKDLISALSEAASETPSYLFRENLWDLANMIHQGRNLDEYLRMKADQVMQIQREIQKSFIEKLARYSEMYISLVLVGILFLSIGAYLIDAMGSTMMDLDADGIFMLLTYGIIPLAVLVTFMIVSMAYSKSG
jgi:flagellar protein FlaJ